MTSNHSPIVTKGSETVGEVSASPEEILQGKEKKDERLGAWAATAICGNDITSSCLYVSGIAIVYAGALAPLALLLAAEVKRSIPRWWKPCPWMAGFITLY